jgi:Domain of unknown function (DUF4832)/Domain of unknown function (DUF4874)
MNLICMKRINFPVIILLAGFLLMVVSAEASEVVIDNMEYASQVEAEAVYTSGADGSNTISIDSENVIVSQGSHSLQVNHYFDGIAWRNNRIQNTFASVQDWSDFETVSIDIYGDPTFATVFLLTISINESDGDSWSYRTTAAIGSASWTTLTFDPSADLVGFAWDMNGDGVMNLSNVSGYRIYLERGSDGAPSSGIMYFDAFKATVPDLYDSLIAADALWKYLDIGTDQGTSWRTPGFDDTSWPSGNGQFGYGEGDENTVIGYGPDPNNKYITSYYRNSFIVSDSLAYQFIIVRILRDDGAVLYLNGTEVVRINMPAGPVDYLSIASEAPDDGQAYFEHIVDAGYLVDGVNVLAVELHQSAADDPDAGFDLELLAGDQFYYSSDSSFFLNPERGLYGYGPMVDSTNFNSLRASGVTVCYAHITLDDYRTSNISTTRLNEITNAFSRMRSAGIKGIIRINYNEDGGADTSLVWMETHLQQLQPVLNANADVIAFFQAGMIGAWGEWHSSTSGLANPAGRSAVWSLLRTYLPACRFIQVRTPDYVYELEGAGLPLADGTAFACDGPSLIGHHNDCWLASSTDYGTYSSDAVTREQQKSRIENDTRYVPWGGETCSQSAYSNCTVALAEAARFHATYLNKNYNLDVIGELAPCWDEIKNSLGYRFELISSSFPTLVQVGGQFSFSISLRNVGWAPVYNERPVYLSMYSGSTVVMDYELTGEDPRLWNPEEGIITLTGTLTAPAVIMEETVGFALWLPDEASGLRTIPEYSIRFANTGVWDDLAGHNILIENVPVTNSSVDTWNSY